MNNVETSHSIHDLLAGRAGDLASLTNGDGEMEEMTNPVLTEWVLIANVVDLESDDDVRLTVVAAPSMLHSHVVGLLTVATAL